MKATEKPLWNELERSIHEPARLVLVTTLCSAEDGLGFQALKEECGLTDGNLSRHLKVLEEAGIVLVQKAGKGRSSRTKVMMSDAGREAFLKYLHSLEKVLHGAIETLEGDARSSAGLTLAVS
jgi:DNA-binding transcriptional ArsR family regulator